MRDLPTPAARLTASRLRAGMWEALLETGGAAQAPAIEAVHLDTRLQGVSVTPDPTTPGRFLISVPVPAEILSDGVQTVLIRNAETGEILDSLAILAGVPLEQDIRAEIDLLRAELDMLKKAFRRHCLETM